MMVMDVILITGESGVGKSTFAKHLEEKDWQIYEVVKSFTTRPQRDKEDTDHIFIPHSVGVRMFFFMPCVARSVINNELYFTIEENFSITKTNLYITDKKGMEHLCTNYPDWNIGVVKIVSDEVDVSDGRKNRNITVPTDDECDMIIKRVGNKYFEVIDGEERFFYEF